MPPTAAKKTAGTGSAKKITFRAGKKRRSAKATFSLALRRKLGVTQGVMGRLIGASMRSVVTIEKKPLGDLKKENRRRLKEIDRLRVALEEITEPDTIAEWLEQPNKMFNGATPLDLIERGESDRIWQMIYQLRSGEPL